MQLERLAPKVYCGSPNKFKREVEFVFYLHIRKFSGGRNLRSLAHYWESEVTELERFSNSIIQYSRVELMTITVQQRNESCAGESVRSRNALV